MMDRFGIQDTNAGLMVLVFPGRNAFIPEEARTAVAPESRGRRTPNSLI